ncbi:MAG: SusC/RagA family TonB-linked outer membrane protein [Bacteroidales bacterium]|nr:SusC/RagA family TonB-linked outer membrane protein [Bacteroidales bacterium]
MKRILNIILIIFCVSLVAQAQKKNDKIVKYDLSFVVKDSDGQPISKASVFALNGKIELETNDSGAVNLEQIPANTKILIQKDGYKLLVWDLAKEGNKAHIMMEKAIVGNSPKETYDLYPGIRLTKRQTTGAVSMIEGKELETMPTLALTNALQGRASGLWADMMLGAMSENKASFLIRGNGAVGTGNGPIVVVDGMERPMNDLIAEEIETIQILKDPTSKILYGPRSANGIISITTKRGEAYKRIVKTSVEQYVSLTTRRPEYLNSYEYARLYNKALENDGLAPIYSNKDLEGYQDSKGENDMFYPDVDYQDYFLRNYTTNTRAVAQFLGGDNKTQYAVVMGINNGKGLEKQGDGLDYTRVNLRGNVDMNLNEIFSANLGLAVRIENKRGAKMNSGELFNRIKSTRPNEYPFILDSSQAAGVPVLEDGSPVAGASEDKNSNLYADVVLDGYDKNQYINNQMNLGLKADFNSFVKGLTGDMYITFDNYFRTTYRLNKKTPTYSVRVSEISDTSSTIEFIPQKLEELDVNENIESRESDRNLGASAKLNYERTFDDHYIQANLGYYYFLNEVHGFGQNVVTANTFLRAHYSYNNNLILEGTVANMRSIRFAEDMQRKVYPAVGAAYVLSENVPSLGYFKIKANFGIIGYDASTKFPLRENRWSDNTDDTKNDRQTITFGDGNNGKTYPVVHMFDYSSPNLGWEESTELNFGVEGLVLDYRLGYELNAFMEKRENIPGVIGEKYSSTYGDFVPHTNYKSVSNSGVEAEINWLDRIGDIDYKIGARVSYAKNKFTEKDEIAFEDEDRRLEGKPTDAILGYVSEGLFTSLDQIANNEFQELGTQTDVGDINYKDLNGDGVINELDQEVIGNEVPRVVLGVDLNLTYKQFGFYALGTAALGYHINPRDVYYTAGSEKYMSHAYDAYDPVTNTGTLPRLTSTGRAANNVSSDFWLEKGDYLRLKNIELSYTHTSKSTAIYNKAKLYLRGSNLLVLSKVKDLDPEVPMSGIDNYSVLRTFSLGLSVNF